MEYTCKHHLDIGYEKMRSPNTLFPKLVTLLFCASFINLSLILGYSLPP